MTVKWGSAPSQEPLRGISKPWIYLKIGNDSYRKKNMRPISLSSGMYIDTIFQRNKLKIKTDFFLKERIPLE
ncbi:hypothetical protein BS1321_21190 [Peribacillus simplex NBRC 15720 = DSM 1321]|uniref:Uncharacterized protein n=1 Tax=Peribacillus simplex NBRC 15720 = DSM 1321 TaxID=1349754 RepID=A0A223ELV0_9BACI|nr:hypothetical protein BS1321_21190 [Peribacillus simplex NBRC 15720 = DSM 1321]CAH0257763.1 hypothetical protein SRABI84_03286 [Peribacillus simplex]